jgi:hypothetical protein
MQALPAEREGGARELPRHALPRLGPELGVAALLALAAGLLYAATWQTRFFGDGPGLYAQHVLGEGRTYPHILFHALCTVLQRAFGGADPGRGPQLLAILSAASGVGLGWLVFRGCGAARFGAGVASGLLALSPVLWFFGTTIEVHATLYATAAFVAAVTLWAPWQRPALALAMVTAAFPLLHFAHQSSFVLGPGFVFLVQFARARRGPPYSWRALLLGVGPLLLAALLAGGVFAWCVRFGGIAKAWSEVALELGGTKRYVEWENTVWRDEWLLPLGLLVPLALAGFPRLRREPRLTLAVGTLLGVSLAFFLWWNVLEGGGYFLGSAPFLGIPIAFLFGAWSPRKGALALVLLAVQGGFAHSRITTRDHGWDPATRTAQVRAALGESGLLLTTTELAPDVRCELPGVEESSLVLLAHGISRREQRLVTPEELLAEVGRFLERLHERHPHVALDLSYRNLGPTDSPALAHFRPHLAAFEAFLRERYVVRELPHPDWPMLVLEARR